jgi:hypothetical protein
VAGREDDTNEPMSTQSDEVLPVDLDMDNFETKRDTRSTKDPSEVPLHEKEASSRSATSPHLTIVPPCVEPAEEQEENIESDEKENADTIIASCVTSDRGSECSDDSDDEDYVAEPLPPAKRRRVRFSDTVKYASDGSQEIPMSPADTVDDEGQGNSPDLVYVSEEIPIRGTLKLKEVNGELLYYFTFSQGQGQKHSDRSNNLRSTCSKGTTSSLVQGPGGVLRGRYKFKKEDDDKIIQMKKEGKSWDEIAEEISGSTKGSIQVRYSTKLKDRMGTPKRVSKRRWVE